jgi:A/G-specific adenine glycosylase
VDAFALHTSPRLTPSRIARFRHTVYEHYRRHGRIFPWRETTDPYRILVSEVMLQQTQTSRVEVYYPRFIEEYPDFVSLAGAPLSGVLQLWQGLGYNRRALALHRLALRVVTLYDRVLPSSPESLLTLPGVGRYTASAVAAIAFNQPTTFIETNIRTVFLQFFFDGRGAVTDKEILPFVEATLDKENPRKWYYALFDYGAMLKKTLNMEANSAHYRRQSPFKGSTRQLRGQILRFLLASSPVSEAELIRQLPQGDGQIKKALNALQREGFITVADSMIALSQ